MALRLLAFLVAAAVVADGAVVKAKVSPIQKVTELLKGLQAKITKEGETEAAEYDKYACFCKDEVTSRRVAIEKSVKKLASLNTKKNKVDATVIDLTGKCSTLGATINTEEGKKTTAQTDAKNRLAAYNTADAKTVDSIGQAAEALKVMDKAKGGLDSAKINLIQVQELIKKANQPKYEFQGNAIKKMIDGLIADFKKTKKADDMDEADKKGMSDTKIQGLEKMIKFTKQEKAEKDKLNAEASAESSDLQTAITQEQADLDSDNAYMATLTKDCEDKAVIFDQRSKNRVDEITAMTGAIDSLQKGAGAPKLFVQKEGSTISLVQVHQTIQEKGNRVVKRVLELLQDAAEDQHSEFLKQAAARVMISTDHFVKVRNLIRDLLTKLTSDAAAEASEKAFCDTQLTLQTGNRDTAQMNAEKQTAIIQKKTAEKVQLEKDIVELTQGIAKNTNAIKEGTALRGTVASSATTKKWSDAEAADVSTTIVTAGTGNAGANEEAIKVSTEGSQAVGVALGLLSTFYNAQTFVQTDKYTPPGAGRDGKTLADKAPSSQATQYKGAAEESKGIMGMLEVIKGDFDRTTQATTDNESNEASAWATAKGDLDTDNTNKNSSKTTKEGTVSQLTSDLLAATNDLAQQNTMLETTEKALAKLKSRCIDDEETTEQRFAQRKQEIASLKDAQKILDEMSQKEQSTGDAR